MSIIRDKVLEKLHQLKDNAVQLGFNWPNPEPIKTEDLIKLLKEVEDYMKKHS